MSGFPIRQNSSVGVPVLLTKVESFLSDGPALSGSYAITEAGLSLINLYRAGNTSAMNILSSQDWNTDSNGDGVFYVSVPSSGTDTLGPLSLVVLGSGIRPVQKDCVVLSTNAYDSLYSTGTLDVNVISMDNNVITSGTLAASAITEIQDGITISGDFSTALEQYIIDLSGTVNDLSGTVDEFWDYHITTSDTLSVDVNLALTAILTVDNIVDAILVDTSEIGIAGSGLTAITPILTGVTLAADQSQVTNFGAYDVSTNDISVTIDGNVPANVVQINSTGTDIYFAGSTMVSLLNSISDDVDTVQGMVVDVTGAMLRVNQEYTITTENGTIETTFS